ncbi:hypothetical protein R84B8_00525 [Treponema sp. R8-4-B8]
MKFKPLFFLALFFSCEALLFPSGKKENKNVEWFNDVRLENYAPFKSSRLATLPAKSSLMLKNNLPKLDGATALFPVYASFVQAVYPKSNYNKVNGKYQFDSGFVRCTTTPNAYKSLINGDVDIIFCMEPSKDQIQEAKEKGLTLNMTPIGKDAFVFIVDAKNPVNNISSAQIRGIYSGKITNWKELGWEDYKIEAFQRNKGSGSQTLLESIMGDTPIIEPARRQVVYKMTSLFTGVAVIFPYPPTTIGYTFLYFTTDMVNSNLIKILAIDGVKPSRETIISGEYIFSNTFYAITTGNETDNAKKFINWILSEEGQYLVEKTGYVPINKGATK